MNTAIRISIAAVLAAGLAACGTADIRNMQVKGGDFEKALRDGYATLADAEYDESDFGDANSFADRARLAAMGTPTGPEPLNARKLVPPHSGDLAAARARLTKVLDGGAAKRMPFDAAAAQVAFDCWMQEAEENLQPVDIAQCRGSFDAAMAKLEVMPKPMAAKPAPEKKKAAAPKPPQTLRSVLYFDLDKSTLTNQAKAALDIVKDDLKRAKGAAIYVSGYADRAGSAAYNQKLAGKRVNTVVVALTALGVKKSAIGTVVHGESRPAVETRDGVAEARNRGVEIAIVN
jgi:OOP family OmpA-OmpF porin